MKVKYRGEVHEAKIENGRVLSLDGRVYFGHDGALISGCEEVIEPPNEGWLVADIKAWLDNAGIEYKSSMTKAELLGLV